ncbi:DUF2637 domain-containing protein [Streptomyces sp. NPDC003011]
MPGAALPQLTRIHRILIGVIVTGVVTIAAIGFAGSYTAVRELARHKGFGTFSYIFPIGLDAGICVLLALDLLLTWTRIPFPLLRHTAWLLTAATIAFNGAAAWPDPLGVGMHAVIPILFVVSLEAARHAIGRIADITADTHIEGIRPARWILAPIPTFLLWRRMKLWELRSYEQIIKLEQERLTYQARLHARFGRTWRRKAPVEALLPLRLARYGVPLAQTIPADLAPTDINATQLTPQPLPYPRQPEHARSATAPEREQRTINPLETTQPQQAKPDKALRAPAQQRAVTPSTTRPPQSRAPQQPPQDTPERSAKVLNPELGAPFSAGQAATPQAPRLNDPYAIPPSTSHRLPEKQAPPRRFVPQQRTPPSARQTTATSDVPQTGNPPHHPRTPWHHQQHPTLPAAAAPTTYLHEHNTHHDSGSQPTGNQPAGHATSPDPREPDPAEPPTRSTTAPKTDAPTEQQPDDPFIDNTTNPAGETTKPPTAETPQSPTPNAAEPTEDATDPAGHRADQPRRQAHQPARPAISAPVHTARTPHGPRADTPPDQPPRPPSRAGDLTASDRYYLAWMHYQAHHGKQPSDQQLSAHLAQQGLLGRGGNPISPANLRRHFLNWRIYNVWTQHRAHTATPDPTHIAHTCTEQGITAQYNKTITPTYIAKQFPHFERRWRTLNTHHDPPL